MAFPKTGVVPAPKIVPSAFGLLVVAKPENSVDEDMWTRGFSQEWETELSVGTNWDDTDSTSYEIFTNATPTRHVYVKPFFIEATENISTLGFRALDRMARISRQLEGMTQRAMEEELWDGVIRRTETHENLSLNAASATLVNGTTALTARRALASLEQLIGENSPAGEQGVIHMTRDMAALLSSSSQLIVHNKEFDHLQTLGGTPIIVGSGYSGAGPVGATGEAASLINKWIYATGTVKTYLGKVDVVNDNLAQAYDVSGNQNDMKLKAIRPAAVYFDTSIHLAVRVDLSA